MKKRMAGISVLALILSLLAACAAVPGTGTTVSDPPSVTTAAIEPAATPSPDAIVSESPLPAGINRTADISALDPFEPPAEETPLIGGGVALLEFWKIYYDAADLSEDAKDIVVGEVLAIYCTDVDAQGMIFYDFKLSEVLRGDLGVGDTITVASYGGYIRQSVFVQVYGHEKFNRPLTEDGLIVDSGSGVPFPAVGDQYVLFMEGHDNSQFPPGVYGVCGGFMGRYYLDGESVKRHVPDDSPYFYIKNGERYDPNDPIPNDPKTLSELRTVVAKTPLIDKQTSSG